MGSWSLLKHIRQQKLKHLTGVIYCTSWLVSTEPWRNICSQSNCRPSPSRSSTVVLLKVISTLNISWLLKQITPSFLTVYDLRQHLPFTQLIIIELASELCHIKMDVKVKSLSDQISHKISFAFSPNNSQDNFFKCIFHFWIFPLKAELTICNRKGEKKRIL